jgi:DNA-binding transcriptional LysR family regulator
MFRLMFGGPVPVAEGIQSPAFRLLVVPGVTVDRWVRTWSERLPGVHLQLVSADDGQTAALLSARADAGLVRLPVDPSVFHAIPLYTEATVVVVPRDHKLAAAEDEVTVADLADETLLRPLDDVLAWTDAPAAVMTELPATTAAAVELVAAGGGVLVTAQSLARAYHRRDLTYRVVTDAPTSSVALVWRREEHSDLIEELIGIVRGRTVNSTRGPARPPDQPSARKGVRRDSANPRTPPRRRGR